MSAIKNLAVVVTCHQAYLKYFRPAMQSIVGQDCEAEEKVIVFDGALRPKRKGWQTFKVLLDNANAVRNYGLKQTKAEWVLQWDADCLMPPGFLRNIASVIESADRRVGFIYTDVQYYTPPNILTRRLLVPQWTGSPSFNYSLVAHSSVYRRQAIVDAGFWSEKPTSLKEYRLCWRIANHGWVGFKADATETLCLRKDSSKKAVALPKPQAQLTTDKMWIASAILTAPRKNSTLKASLHSLAAAGFRCIIRAEPNSDIPDEYQKYVVFNRVKLGVLRNMYETLEFLVQSYSKATVLAIFQDDIQISAGVAKWLEGELWPDWCPVASLYTPNCYADKKSGWRILKLGFYRTFGALGLLWRRDAAIDFLRNEQVKSHVRQHPNRNADATVGYWALQRGHGIAYHTPSLVRHTGDTSTLRDWNFGPQVSVEIPEQVEDIPRITIKQSTPEICLIGWNTAQGLGYMNRDIAKHLNIKTWIIPKHPRFVELPDTGQGDVEIVHTTQDPPVEAMREWLVRHDWILFCEYPFIKNLPGLAREAGVPVACIPMLEWMNPRYEWAKFVDLFIAPNKQCERILKTWRRIYGFTWRIEQVDWPIEIEKFPYRQREKCESFLFNNGTGGSKGKSRQGYMLPPRKGLDVVVKAASLVRDIPVFIRSQVSNVPELTENVKLLGPSADNSQLYDLGDMSIQPSRFEGLGLQAIESQAAGIPVITTDAPPMNEHNPASVIPASPMEFSLSGEWLEGYEPDAVKLAEIMKSYYGKDISELSRASRDWVVRTHSWEAAGPKIMNFFIGE